MSEEHGGGMAAHDNVGSKRHRRPSVRLGDIGGNHFSNKASKNLTLALVDTNTKENSSSRKKMNNWSNVVDEDDNRDVNLDDVAIGSWKIKSLKSKKGTVTQKIRSGWTTKANDKMVSVTDVQDLENNENSGDSPLHSCDNNHKINDNLNMGIDIDSRTWKIRSLKSKKGTVTKKIRSGWGSSKANDSEKHDKILSTTDVEDSGHSPVHSYDNNKINDNVNMGVDIVDRGIGNVNSRKSVGTRVSEEGPTDTERNGVKVWLNQLGLGQYSSLFEIHQVDDEVLPMLTLEDLKDMGVNAVGSRRKMYCSIQNLNKGFS
ncbi:uncharacterized protein LOC132634132 [Lycium barbarum]|uniref:uncharacterized protein LOC132634132 n=1 Tax=Lycium barbarum TaxID=112863 RepID=UPI00293EBEFE|nr:uncharacterized protein LOC132634132 [Lycium barbarum]